MLAGRILAQLAKLPLQLETPLMDTELPNHKEQITSIQQKLPDTADPSRTIAELDGSGVPTHTYDPVLARRAESFLYPWTCCKGRVLPY